MLLRNVEVDGRRVDVRLGNGMVVEVGARLAGAAGLDGRGAALLPGLHDHHLHLLAAAAATESVDVGPPAVRDRSAFLAALSAAAHGGWVRAVNYDESVAGPLDRAMLDGVSAAVPVRVQHRSGALWVLNSAALDALGLEDAVDHDGVERDATGRATGRIWRADARLTEAVGLQDNRPPPDLRALGERLSSYGITGVTDATPSLAAGALTLITAAHTRGDLPQRVTLLAAEARAASSIAVGPVKIVVADHALPGLDELTTRATAARADNRAVAFHCVTHEALLLVLATLDEVGAREGDRVEHAAVTPPAAAARLAALGVRVVTQPSLPARRGDDYLDRTDADERPYLWPYRSLLDAGVRVAASSDAPYGDLDPWAGMRAATTRRTTFGRVIGPGEQVDPATALAGYLSAPDDPGGPPRRVRVGAAADLVLLDVPLAAALVDPDAGHVRTTLIGGRIVHSRDHPRLP